MHFYCICWWTPSFVCMDTRDFSCDLCFVWDISWSTPGTVWQYGGVWRRIISRDSCFYCHYCQTHSSWVKILSEFLDNFKASKPSADGDFPSEIFPIPKCPLPALCSVAFAPHVTSGEHFLLGQEEKGAFQNSSVLGFAIHRAPTGELNPNFETCWIYREPGRKSVPLQGWSTGTGTQL